MKDVKEYSVKWTHWDSGTVIVNVFNSSK